MRPSVHNNDVPHLHTRDMTRSDVQHESFRCVTWLISTFSQILMLEYNMRIWENTVHVQLSIRHHTATHCTVQRNATYCNTEWRSFDNTSCNTLQHTATLYTLQRTAVQNVDLWTIRTATHCNTLQHTATHCNTLHSARHCSIPQHWTGLFRQYTGFFWYIQGFFDNTGGSLDNMGGSRFWGLIAPRIIWRALCII